MNKFIFWIITFVLALVVSCSQQKRYISYQVKEGETIRNIAERINVTPEELNRLNPDLRGSLSVNSVIIIPNPEYKKAISLIQKPADKSTISTDNNELKDDNNVVSDNSKIADSTQIIRTIYDYKTHTVQSGETVYRLTKLYDISKSELVELNPQFEKLKDDYLDVGQKLKIKVTERRIIYISREEDLKTYLTHTVQSKETVYGLTRFYNISKDDLIQLNPEYPEIINDKLKTGQILRVRNIEGQLNTGNNLIFTDTIASSDSDIKVAMLFPFRAKAYDTIPYDSIFDIKKNRRYAHLANIATDFYLGSEIAIDSLKNLGVNLNVSIFDTGDRNKSINKIIENDLLKDANVIIGPFYSEEAELVAEKTEIPLIFPLYSKKQNQFSSPEIIKSAPDKNTRSQFLADYLLTIYNGANIFIISDGKTVSERQTKKIAETLKKHDSVKEIHILKPENNYIKKERFIEKMKPDSHNWIIITSDNSVSVADTVNSMVVLPENITAQVFSIDKGNEYADINNNTLARIGFTYISDSYLDFDDLNLKKFFRKYKLINNDIPSEYAIRGFDITFDTLMRLASGKKLSETFQKGASIRLKNKFDFNKKIPGSFSNQGLFIIRYDSDLTLERIK